MSMGGVEVIMPTNHLRDRLPYHNHSTMKPLHNHNHKHNHTRSNRRKRSPVRKSGEENNINTAVVTNKPVKNLTMEHVKILKRGESLNEAKSDRPSTKVETVDDLAAKATDRLNKMSIADFYAGFGFFDSPPPSSVPLPAFFTKKSSSRDEDPSAGLRKILGLDFH